MFKRFFLIFTVFFMYVQTIFAFNPLSPLKEVFGQNGIFGLLTNQYVVISLMFFAMLAGFFNIVKFALKPVFRNNTKERNVVAFMVSFIGITGIFFIYRASPVQMITTFGGTVGFFLISIFMLSGLKGIDNWLVSLGIQRGTSKKWWLWMSISGFVITSALIGFLDNSIMSYTNSANSFFGYIYNTLGFVQSWSIIIVIGLFLSLVFSIKRNNKINEELNKDEELVKVNSLIQAIEKDVIKLKQYGEMLKGAF